GSAKFVRVNAWQVQNGFAEWTRETSALVECSTPRLGCIFAMYLEFRDRPAEPNPTRRQPTRHPPSQGWRQSRFAPGPTPASALRTRFAAPRHLHPPAAPKWTGSPHPNSTWTPRGPPHVAPAEKDR